VSRNQGRPTRKQKCSLFVAFGIRSGVMSRGVTRLRDMRQIIRVSATSLRLAAARHLRLGDIRPEKKIHGSAYPLVLRLLIVFVWLVSVDLQ
jgi:hypothetical protein